MYDIGRLAKEENIAPLVSTNYQASLRSRIERCVAASFARADGFLEKGVWEGGYTVVVLSVKSGRVLAYAVNATGPVYEKYGNLLPYAMKKAVLRLHLELAGRRGGLDLGENHAYIRRLLPKNENIYLGEDLSSFKGTRDVVIGVSGAPLASGYRHELAPMLPADAAMEFVAGAADQVFAQFLGISHRPFTEFEEPEMFAWLRRAH